MSKIFQTIAGTISLAAAVLCAACAPASRPLTPDETSFARSGLADQKINDLIGSLDPATRALAARHDPYRRQVDGWGRAEGWTSLSVTTPPDLGFGEVQGSSAIEINAIRPFAGLPVRPMKPFVLKGEADDRARALTCLTQVVYYEAAREPGAGQQAVAQVVLNRLRHPAYPKSVCAVVYQGSARTTGCQFTFTCDGSLRFTPEPDLWRRAQTVARQALAGHVDRQVGSATHYHAIYVAPYWAPTLVKMRQVGAHIFYRWTGPWGEPPAFTGQYAGREAILSPAVLAGGDPRTEGLIAPERQGIPAEKTITLGVAGEVKTYRMVDAEAAEGARTRVRGVLYAPRRQPTPEEVKAINEKLAGVERKMDQEP
ncbi:cell wall hydrolase [Phenylobacterium immobile]|uniref:cell wall hydrolase n=1 Tax=Phenylobacterium immobile TaxID=21 RepID=UPI000A7D7E49|nr:cell wall hydrolase [Phenylobacterium immobile]